MKYYLINGAVNWAYEFIVYFYEIINEDDYNLYKALQEKYGKWYDDYYFGTNEGWDGDFDYLGFTPIELSDEELEVLDHLNLGGQSVFNVFYEYLWRKLEENGIIEKDADFDSFTLEEKLKAIEKYANMCNE